MLQERDARQILEALDGSLASLVTAGSGATVGVSVGSSVGVEVCKLIQLAILHPSIIALAELI